MSAPPQPHTALLSPLTLTERAAVGEDFFRRCCRIALNVTVLLAGVAAVLALLNPRTSPTGTLVIAAFVSFVALAAKRTTGYERLRRYRSALVLAGPLTAVSPLWSAVDANAVYFPAFAPLMLIACVAQRRRERVAVIVSLTLGTLVAALLDRRSPELSAPAPLAAATISVAIVGILLGVVVDWCARKVLLAPDDADVETQPSLAASPPDVTLGSVADQVERLVRIGEISRASKDQLVRLRPESLSSLTARELQVLFLIAEGLDRYDIGDCLCISPRTVAKHVERVRAKTGLTGTGRPTEWLWHKLPPFPPGRVDQLESGGHVTGTAGAQVDPEP